MINPEMETNVVIKNNRVCKKSELFFDLLFFFIIFYKVLSAALSLALRDRELNSCSSVVGVIGFFVKVLSL